MIFLIVAEFLRKFLCDDVVELSQECRNAWRKDEGLNTLRTGEADLRF